MILVFWREFRAIGVVEEARAEQYGTVLPVGDREVISSLLFQKCYDAGLVGVIILDHPIIGRGRPADDQAAMPGVEVGFRWRDPEIDADDSIVGMNVDGRLRPQAFEGPGLAQAMLAENFGKGAAQIVGDLQEQRAGQPIFEIRRDETIDIEEVVPDRALQQKAPQ
jgi:hypothetical protein